MNISSSVPNSPYPSRTSERLDVARTLAPVATAIGLTRVARGALIGLGAGALLGAMLVLLGRIVDWNPALPAGLATAAAGILVGAVVGGLHWPKPHEAARAADLYFALEDRLTTALELGAATSPVASMQQQDVAEHISGLTLTRSRGAWLRRREAALAVVAILTLAAVALIPGRHAAHRSVAPTAARTAAARRATIVQLKALTAQLHRGLSTAELQTPTMRKLDAALARLRHQLLQAATPRGALRSISATQQALKNLSAGLHPVNAGAVAKINSSLSPYLGKNGRQSSPGSSHRSSQATAQALDRLARSLAHMTATQRAALARALARAANGTPNNALRAGLRQAASALANSSPQSARSALQQLSQALAQSAGAQAAVSRTAAASQQLNSLKSQIAGTGAAPPTLAAGSRTGAKGTGAVPGAGGRKPGAAGTGAGKGTGTGQGRGSGKGRGTGQGTGRGTGRAPGAGRGSGQGTGRGAGTGASRTGSAGQSGSGNRGAGGTGRAATTRAGRTVTVFVPAQQGKGSDIVRNGPKGDPTLGSQVPYQQVVGRYTQQAHQALDQSTLPPSLQNYVRRYFDTLSR